MQRPVGHDDEAVVARTDRMTLDRQGAAERIVDGQRRMEEAVQATDFLGRSSQEIAPLALPVRDSQ